MYQQQPQCDGQGAFVWCANADVFLPPPVGWIEVYSTMAILIVTPQCLKRSKCSMWTEQTSWLVSYEWYMENPSSCHPKTTPWIPKYKTRHFILNLDMAQHCFVNFPKSGHPPPYTQRTHRPHEAKLAMLAVISTLPTPHLLVCMCVSSCYNHNPGKGT